MRFFLKSLFLFNDLEKAPHNIMFRDEGGHGLLLLFEGVEAVGGGGGPRRERSVMYV